MFLTSKVRIVRVEDKFMIQNKTWFKWKFLPRLSHYLEYTSIRYDHRWLFRSENYEDALKEAKSYKAYFDPQPEDLGIV